MEHYQDWKQYIDGKIKEKEEKSNLKTQKKMEDSIRKSEQRLLQEFSQNVTNWRSFGIYEHDILLQFFQGRESKRSLIYHVSNMLRRIGMPDIFVSFDELEESLRIQIATLLQNHIDTLYIKGECYSHFLDRNVITKEQRLQNVFKEKKGDKEEYIILTEEEKEDVSKIVRSIMKEIIEFAFLQKENFTTIIQMILQLKEYTLCGVPDHHFPQVPSCCYLQENIDAEHLEEITTRYKDYAIRVMDQNEIEKTLQDNIKGNNFLFVREYLYLARDSQKIREIMKQTISQNIQDTTQKIENLLENENEDFSKQKRMIEIFMAPVENWYETLEQLREDEKHEIRI